MHKKYLAFLLLLLPVFTFASNVDVVSDTPSGTYHSPIYITLTPTQPNSKTFYSFKPDGYPNDAFLYTGSILLKHSSPFIYFSIISTSNESKIKQNDYIIDYPSTIHFETDTISGSGQMDISMVNSGSESVNIGYWMLQSESDSVIIPESTMIAPNAKYTVRLNYPGVSSVVLRSPDDEEKDILVPVGSIEQSHIVIPKKKLTITKTTPRTILSIRENPQEVIKAEPTKVADPVTQPPVIAPVVSENLPTSETTASKESTKVSPPSTGTDINQIVKVSSNES